MSTTTPVTDPKIASKPTPLIPPDEQFWQRYSPNHEAPLSGVTSTLLHILGIGLIFMVLWVQNMTHADEENRSLPIEPIRFGGGGGHKGGPGNGSGGNPDD